MMSNLLSSIDSTRRNVSLRGNAGTVLTSLFGVGLSFLTSIAFARLLGLSGRGELAAILLWPLLLPYLTMTGLIDAIVVFIARQKSEQTRIVGNGLLIATVGSILLMVLGYVFMPVLLSNQADWVIRSSQILLIYMPLTFIADIYGNVLRANLAFGAFNLQRLFMPVGLPIGLAVLYLTKNLTVENMVLVYLVLGMLRLFFVLVLCLNADVPLQPRLQKTIARDMLIFGGKIQIGSVAENTNSRLGQILIAAWLTSAQLGLYVTAVGTAQLIAIMSDSIKIALLPSMASENAVERQVKTLRRYFRVYWTASLVLVPIFALSMVWFIPLVYGSAFEEAVAPAVVLALASMLFGAKEVLGTGARAMELPTLASSAEVVSLVVSFVLMLILLRPYGLMGAALSTSVAYCVSLAYLILGLKQKVGISPKIWLQLETSIVTSLKGMARRA